ncbi:hypothetical protein T03_1316 [Trichinella britovi]|uniref:Uncharacterized protein n=1 Tax=Trichinella britovi TaxID=45882 RepID=A0A0V1D1N7_TRIBR|nr:hypothetical protein T03_1316 [Trichinella britovi]
MPNCALCDLISSSLHGKHSRSSYETTIDVNSNKRTCITCIKRFKRAQSIVSTKHCTVNNSAIANRRNSYASHNAYHKTYECFPPFTENLDKYATTNGEDTFTQIP